MSDFLSRIEQLSPKRLALLAVQLQSRLDRVEAERAEPIAIIGLGCRFPGAPNPDAFWRLLDEGGDAVSQVPADRWDNDALFDADPDAAGRIASRWGGFLDRVDLFDAPFFGISRREAVSMDPQQRLALEVAWEALEHAGQSPRALSGTQTGVFLGMSTSDYYGILRSRGLEAIDAYMATGSAHSVAAGRIAYVLGLHGPNFALDTACSSSLIALHLACQSLRMSECRIAIAGGVNVIAAPEVTVALSRSHMMAPDGRCKAFDASADGFVRGEGCGMLVLKRLSDATEDRDRILAVIRGSAVNQDGRSSGITAPNGAAQRRVIRAALAAARVAPEDVDYVEAHGTGTSLGDPIEAHALAAEFAARGPNRPLVVGSVKSNVGHLEAAAGVAGVMKVVLALQHGRIPPQLHFHQMNPHIDWGKTAVEIPVAGRDWRSADKRRIAGVSSFGFSGSNAHVILEEAPTAPSRGDDQPARALDVLVVSARTSESLDALLGDYASTRFDAGTTLADVTRTASVGRAHFPERAAVVIESPADIQTALASPAVVRGSAESRPKIAFLLTGQGSQWPGMARELYDTEPVFRDAMEECARLLDPHLDRPMLDVLFASRPDAPDFDDLQYTQTTLFALQWSLAQLWKSWGIEPAVILGHSVGEYAALTIAGVWSLEDGIGVIAERARLTKALGAGWGMSAVQCTLRQAEEAIVAARGEVSVAAVNAPESIVLSGRLTDLERVEETLTTAGIQVKRLRIAQAFHSAQMNDVAARLAAHIARVPFNPPKVPLISSVTGDAVTVDQLRDPSYWRRQVCERVEFQKAMETLAVTHDVFLEIGPSTTLLGLGRQSVDREGQTWVSSLRRDESDVRQMLESLAHLYVRGAEVDWAAFHARRPGRTVTLPTYPFQRQRYWPEGVRGATAAPALARIGGHAMLRGRVPAAIPIFQAELSTDAFPFLADHRVGGSAILPGSVFLELALAASAEELGAPAVIHEVQFHEPLRLGSGAHVAQIVITRQSAADATFQILSRADDAAPGEWVMHASGALRTSSSPASPQGDLDVVRNRITSAIEPDEFFSVLESLGIDLGPRCRGIRALWGGDREVLAEVALDETLAGEAGAYRFHPALLDSCLQTFGAALWRAGESGTRVLSRIGELRVLEGTATRVWCHAEVTDLVRGIGRVRIFDSAGALLAEATGLEATAVGRASLADINAPPAEDWFYRLDWVPAPALDRSVAGDVLAGDDIATRLTARASSLFVEHGLGRFDALRPELDALVTAYIARALEQLGLELAPGGRFRPSECMETAGVVARHRALLERLLATLGERGVLRRNGDVWEVVAPPAIDADALFTSLTARYSDFAIELAVTARCATQLAGVLRGTVDPLQLLFPGGSVDELQELYTKSPSARVFNPLIAEVVAQAVAAAQGRAISILEIGAGTGGTTAFVVPRLPANGVEYTFTDVSPLFLARARERFAEYPFMRYEPLDIEAAAAGPRRHDVIIASNVLHATRDLRATLDHVRQRLAPGGLLVLLEGTRPESWVDVTFGMSEGWWAFTDAELRPDYPLVDAHTWLTLLGERGFTNVSAVAPEQGAQQVVLIARAPVAQEVGRWLIASDAGRLGQTLQKMLEARGGTADLFDAASPPDFAAYDRVVDLRGVSLPASSDAAGVAASESALADTLALMRGVARSRGNAAMWVVTRGAQATGAVTGRESPLQAALWGIGRTFALEHPGAWGGLCDLDPAAPDADNAAALVQTILTPELDDQCAIRSGVRHVPRLTRSAPSRRDAAVFSATGKYLVTGGLGNLGLCAARWLVEHGARHVVLNGRAGLPDRSTWDALEPGSLAHERVSAVRALEESGATVEVLVADLTSADGRRALAEAFPPGELRGALHTAAVFDNRSIDTLTPETLAAVVRPKMRGAIAVGELAREKGADFVVLYSSTTSLLGSSGMAAYAAANQFLDAYAGELRANGVPALAVNWGTWDALRDVSDEMRRNYRRAGLYPMASGDALDALGRMIGAAEPQVTIAQIDWTSLKSVYEARRRRPMLESVANRQVAASVGNSREAPRKAPGTLLETLGALTMPERSRRLLDVVRHEAASVLGVGSDEIDPHLGLFDMGMDSLMSVELRSRLEKMVGRKLPSTLTFNYPNVNALTGYLGTLLAPEARAAPAPRDERVEAAQGPAVADADALSEDEIAALLADSLQGLDFRGN